MCLYNNCLNKQADEAMKKSESNQEELLNYSAKEKRIFEDKFRKLMAKYALKKRLVKELKNKNIEQEGKLIFMEEYILELKKHQKTAESVYKNNVSNSITAPAQNQTPMVEQKQSAQQVLPSRAPNIHFRSLSALQVQSNTNVLPYQSPLQTILNIPSNQHYFFGSQYRGYYNNTHYCGYSGLYPRIYM